MTQRTGFDTAAAVTRSMLGWGVVAGPFYLVVGLVLALTREGFDLARHPLSALMLGEGGWMQVVNLGLSGLMVLVAGVGTVRAGARGTGIGVATYGVGMVAGAVFRPDPLSGFPPGQDGATVPSASGILHLASGGVGLVAVAVAAILFGGWLARRGERGRAAWSRVAGAVVLGGFLGGVALGPAGMAGLWLAVVVGFAWLLVASVRVYREVPHPDGARSAA
ncbi:DUF998 domain-containing protein [Promicromonospora citrea]|uniref:DUF998 domain-containing protein n=1 Tax=Promicromonospora citrea TaxID=43677 RepID=A0A8H9GGB1_9MICO|nr:DUF998 domain-containing protein [Promicromonospora citrea]NNH52976.1 DUF998 domain-containing protein [Promicromonospora citrea]GGM21646.1 hypothetical protein GCM10010102_16710 [Promicromonospora citrea]